MSNRPAPDTGSWRAGIVTRPDDGWTPEAPPAGAAPATPVWDHRRRDRRTLLWFGGAAGAVVATGIVVLLVLVFTGDHTPLHPRYATPPDIRPPLARLCPPPSGAVAEPSTGAPLPIPAGPRTVHPDAGISYREYGEPWLPWHAYWARGTLEVAYSVGQQFVTEVYENGTYHATILSGKVPATVNDAVTIDLACTGRQVAADMRASYYPQPNELEPLRDEQRVLGGRPAWVSTFRLHFHEPGLTATSELVAVALIDVGRSDAAVLYVSIPGTHSQYDWVVEDVLRSVRPT
ncbi:MAG TPA: hypothetical protein VFE14_03330 [Micromonosporaceae bacterium]|jgi:hypothetical protein|nr:hypothetical protein [Micromonosporaceae bacterium]